MVLWLGNEDAERLLSPADYVAAAEDGYREYGLGRVIERVPSRTHTYVPTSREDVRFCCRTIEGGIPKLDAYSLRLNSEVPHMITVNGMRRKYKPPAIEGKFYFGLIFLFGIEHGELRAVMHDGYVNQMVTGATGALGVKYLSRKDAHSVGIIGSGWQAQGQLKAVATVRDITNVKVFSLTQANREAFARTMSSDMGVEVTPVSSYEDAVRGTDIVITATSSYDPFLQGDWLEPGQHVDAMGGGDLTNKLQELFADVYERADVVIVNSKPQAQYDEPLDVLEAIDNGATDWDSIAELGRVIAGTDPGRGGDEQITLHRHHTGLGLWYTAAGHALFEAAVAAGAGQEVPDELFNQLYVT